MYICAKVQPNFTSKVENTNSQLTVQKHKHKHSPQTHRPKRVQAQIGRAKTLTWGD